MPAPISDDKLQERISDVLRFRSIIQVHRQMFQEYLNVLENQKDASLEDAAFLLSNIEFEKQIVENIEWLREVIVPLQYIYNSSLAAAAARQVSSFRTNLTSIQQRVQQQGTKKASVLKKKYNIETNFSHAIPLEDIDQSQMEIHTLRAVSLYKTFGKKRVVKGVDFFVNTGEVLGLLGPNGAGKSTSFYMVIGFHKPTSGEVFLDEQKITHLPMYKRARAGIAYLPQDPSVFRKLTVEENIWAILENRRDLTKKRKKEVLEELIEEFSIQRIRHQFAYTLSGGERRRTEIARSLAIDPKFILLDEPFAGIDPIAVADLKTMIQHLKRRGIGVLITDHNVRDTLEITDRAIIINNGEIITQGSRDQILEDEQAREFYLGTDFEM